MEVNLTEVLTNVLLALLSIFVPMALNALKNLYVAKTTAEQRETIERVVLRGVQAAEQYGLTQQWVNAGAQKKALAVKWAQQELAKRGINVDLETISGLVEATVLMEFNKWQASQKGENQAVAQTEEVVLPPEA